MSTSNPYYQRYPADELARTSILTCEEYGLFQRLRDWSWIHEGIPDTPDFRKRIARVFQLSRYKFEKLWKEVENFFELSGGFFFYEPDERKRLYLVDLKAKRKISGILGAQARWSQSVQATDSMDGKPMASAIFEDGKTEWQTDGIPPPPPEPDTKEESHHHPLPPPPQEGGGGGSPPFLNQELGEPITDHEALSRRSIQLGMAPMGTALARKIRDKFPRDWKQDQVTAVLVLHQGQTSPGMWGNLTRKEMEDEAARQHPTRTPPASAQSNAEWAAKMEATGKEIEELLKSKTAEK